ncbi:MULTISPECIES: heme lyase NrfEFG subunit NrfF [Pseudomonadati]|uniref:Formate-dependent nitrite reductase complex subunit n=1 Tax=Shewanella aestuarii TaxID=1028752 RepID=A0ABT0L6V1_9GAMM|nr:heme lyase NrfEFG subunit NrfF [Shewanella aestuarii]MCL1118921.1 heme lyase NrfEFG subunit NrfF [Shewanella aestuarii]GGN84024.1 cytochrome c biogenesis protein [Shewanella aestuarii]
MKLVNLSITLFVALLFSLMVQATPVDTYEFKSPSNQKRAISLAHELRCPQCQNQNLVDSNSPVAQDLRLEVYKMVDEGKSDDEIVEFMTSRYGDFVLYKPRLDPKTYVLWIGPFALLIFGFIIGAVLIRRQRHNANSDIEMSAEDQQQLDELLKRNK